MPAITAMAANAQEGVRHRDQSQRHADGREPRGQNGAGAEAVDSEPGGCLRDPDTP